MNKLCLVNIMLHYFLNTNCFVSSNRPTNGKQSVIEPYSNQLVAYTSFNLRGKYLVKVPQKFHKHYQCKQTQGVQKVLKIFVYLDKIMKHLIVLKMFKPHV